MPARYVIHPKQAPPRFRPVGKLGIVEWREDCSSCHNCVKKACVYGFYRDEGDTLRREIGYLDYIYQCKGCLNCVQNCTKNILTRVVNPECERLGDEYYTPEIVLTTWYQAETGHIPVSGCGYGGKFSGPGFDSMWTDMSEIVRPTRDGIHGREYIHTGVEIGRRLDHLSFANGDLNLSSPPRLESPMPLIFEAVPEHWRHPSVVSGILTAAAEMGVFAAVGIGDIQEPADGRQDLIVPVLEKAEAPTDGSLSAARLVIVPDSEDMAALRSALKAEKSDRIVAVRLEAGPDCAARAAALARDGAEAIHLVFDPHGRETAAAKPRHMRDVLRQVHGALIEEGIRDLITLVASGGVAMPEHMAKAIICGADMVAIDVPLVLALECRLCGECERGERCQISLSEIDPGFAARRIVNLMCAWRNQLLELLGAMGIREVRRLRGETGRCMFFEDLERETFGRIFGKRKEEGGGEPS